MSFTCRCPPGVPSGEARQVDHGYARGERTHRGPLGGTHRQPRGRDIRWRHHSCGDPESATRITRSFSRPVDGNEPRTPLQSSTTTCADYESRPTVADRWHIAVTTPGGRLSWLMRFDPRSGGRLAWARPGSLATSRGRERASGLDLQIRPSRRPSATASNLE
jgi:hypothetical protein